jgi:hypothetical protein
MNRKYAWVFPVITGAVLLGCWLYTVISEKLLWEQPVVALGTLVLLVAVSAPVVCLQYWRARKYPLVVEVTEAASNSFSGTADRESIVFRASRFKMLAWFLAIFAGCAVFGGLGYAQRGVCRVVGLGTILPLIVWNTVFWTTLFISPPRLFLTPDGLSVEYPWATRRWGWSQIGAISVAKINLPIPILRWLAPRQSRVSMMVRFKLNAPAGSNRSIPWGGVRSIWPVHGEALGDLISAARQRWAGAQAGSWQPVRASTVYYIRAYVPALLFGCIVLFLYLHPCG